MIKNVNFDTRPWTRQFILAAFVALATMALAAPAAAEQTCPAPQYWDYKLKKCQGVSCIPGQYFNTSSWHCRPCPSGTIPVLYGGSGDTVACGPCPTGKVPTPNHAACMTPVTCAPDTLIKKTATDVQCVKCPDGQRANPQQTYCVIVCKGGFVLSYLGAAGILDARACAACARGSVSNLDHTKCIACTSGSSPNADRTACVSPTTPIGPARVLQTPPRPGGAPVERSTNTPGAVKNAPGLGTQTPAGAGTR
jgi:hypothetical protein